MKMDVSERLFKKNSRKSAKNHFSIVPEIDPLIDSLIFKVNSSNIFNYKNETFIRQLELCKHKLSSMYYHKNRIHLLEKSYKKELKLSIPQTGVDNTILSIETPDIIFEFESFLFQTKAFLDVYSKLIGIYFNQKPYNIKRLKKLLSDNTNIKAKLLMKILNKNWIDQFTSKNENISMRDIVTHYSKLNNSPFGILVIKKKKKDTIGVAVEGKKIRDYTRMILKNSKSLLKKSTLTILKEI